MMATIKLADGRGELYQWDTGRKVVIDDETIKQVHYQNRFYGRTIDVDVSNGTAIIPDQLLQSFAPLVVFAWAGSTEDGYTKIEKTFEIHKRNKPADYVFTPVDQKTLDDLQKQIGNLGDLTTEAKENLVAAINEAAASGGGSSDAVLYTAQTLTDEQQKQARENIDAASDFVITGTLDTEGNPTLDKTFAQIQAAIQGGKWPVVKLLTSDGTGTIPLIGSSENGLIFGVPQLLQSDKNSATFITLLSGGAAIRVTTTSPSFNSAGAMPQFKMASGPTTDMQIATKKYVDDNKTTVPTSLKNPNALTIKIGSTTVTYDGSTAKTVEIADGSEVSY